ncbi:transposase [Rhodococcus opacus M213]|uniref:Transposase n=1 Tax=Rhodococcus opacus M213 TaxID=1129896 RepID=K8XQR9_RHOOP|nr:transposase [Rhodococcus opacus M213]
MGIYRACASEWVTCFREFGELGLLDRASVPHYPPTATPTSVVARIEKLRSDKKWSARRIAHELSSDRVRQDHCVGRSGHWTDLAPRRSGHSR